MTVLQWDLPLLLVIVVIVMLLAIWDNRSAPKRPNLRDHPRITITHGPEIDFYLTEQDPHEVERRMRK
jgi:hypothetical protein